MTGNPQMEIHVEPFQYYCDYLRTYVTMDMNIKLYYFNTLFNSKHIQDPSPTHPLWDIIFDIFWGNKVQMPEH